MEVSIFIFFGIVLVSIYTLIGIILIFMSKTNIQKTLRTLYLYIVAIISLVLMVVGSIWFIHGMMGRYVFQIDQPIYSSDPESECLYRKPAGPDGQVPQMSPEEMEKCKIDVVQRNKENALKEFKDSMSTALSMLLISFPLFVYHWRIIQRENKKEDNDE